MYCRPPVLEWGRTARTEQNTLHLQRVGLWLVSLLFAIRLSRFLSEKKATTVEVVFIVFRSRSQGSRKRCNLGGPTQRYMENLCVSVI